MDGIVHGITKSCTRLCDFHTTLLYSKSYKYFTYNKVTKIYPCFFYYLYGLTFSTFKFLIYLEVEWQEEMDTVLFFLYGYLSVPY